MPETIIYRVWTYKHRHEDMYTGADNVKDVIYNNGADPMKFKYGQGKEECLYEFEVPNSNDMEQEGDIYSDLKEIDGFKSIEILETNTEIPSEKLKSLENSSP